MRKRSIAALMTLLGSLATVVVFAAPASAASCVVNTPTITYYNQALIAHGSISSGCGGSGTLEIQRNGILGIWIEETSVTIVAGGSGDVGYGCAGTGTHTYRAYLYAKNAAGTDLSKASAPLRVTCSG